MNQWVRFHREVLEEERREAALAVQTGKSAKTPTDTVSRSDPASRRVQGQFPSR